MELKHAFLLVIIAFGFLISYGYAQADESVSECNKHFYFDADGNRHCDEIDGYALDDYLNQSLAKYKDGHNICFIDFIAPYFDKANPRMMCKSVSSLTETDGERLYANSIFAQLRENKDLEFFFLHHASLLGHAQANFNLGMVYYNGMFNQPQDREKSYLYMLSAAVGGYPKAMHNVAEMKLIGDGTEKDLTIAFHWYKKAANEDLTNSIFMLGKMYEMGWGIKQSNQDALHWYLKAALKNDTESLLRIATLIRHDKNLGYDTQDSLFFVYIASRAGDNQATQTLELFKKQGILSPDHMLALALWFEGSCQENNIGPCVSNIQTNQMVRY